MLTSLIVIIDFIKSFKCIEILLSIIKAQNLLLQRRDNSIFGNGNSDWKPLYDWRQASAKNYTNFSYCANICRRLLHNSISKRIYQPFLDNWTCLGLHLIESISVRHIHLSSAVKLLQPEDYHEKDENASIESFEEQVNGCSLIVKNILHFCRLRYYFSIWFYNDCFVFLRN